MKVLADMNTVNGVTAVRETENFIGVRNFTDNGHGQAAQRLELCDKL